MADEAWDEAEAVARTPNNRARTYWSRSRNAFWVKGESSGHNVQELVRAARDCDRDACWTLVTSDGACLAIRTGGCVSTTAVRDGRKSN